MFGIKPSLNRESVVIVALITGFNDQNQSLFHSIPFVCCIFFRPMTLRKSSAPGNDCAEVRQNKISCQRKYRTESIADRSIGHDSYGVFNQVLTSPSHAGLSAKTRSDVAALRFSTSGTVERNWFVTLRPRPGTCPAPHAAQSGLSEERMNLRLNQILLTPSG